MEGRGARSGLGRRASLRGEQTLVVKLIPLGQAQQELGSLSPRDHGTLC